MSVFHLLLRVSVTSVHRFIFLLTEGSEQPASFTKSATIRSGSDSGPSSIVIPHQGQFCPLRKFGLSCMETFWEGMLITASEILPNILQCVGWDPQQRITHSKMSVVSKLRRPGLTSSLLRGSYSRSLSAAHWFILWSITSILKLPLWQQSYTPGLKPHTPRC